MCLVLNISHLLLVILKHISAPSQLSRELPQGERENGALDVLKSFRGRLGALRSYLWHLQYSWTGGKKKVEKLTHNNQEPTAEPRGLSGFDVLTVFSKSPDTARVKFSRPSHTSN